MSPLVRVLFVVAALAAPLSGQVRNVAAWNLGEGGLALDGYDPVAYFDEGGGVPVRGEAEWTLAQGGATYRFASAEHRALFAQDPARFEPAFGGWCAYAMAKGRLVDPDPRAFRIGEGRLLLFSDADDAEVDGRWTKDEHALLVEADAAWKARSGEEARSADPSTWRPVREFNLSADSLAIAGYDPVSYFPEGGGKPTKGRPGLAATHLGVKYLFASEAHRKAFLADPSRFEPMHGGWCSYAMGRSGEKVEVDPTAFRLTNGQLHLFYVGWFADTREDWDADTARLKKDADAHWEKLVEAARKKDGGGAQG